MKIIFTTCMTFLLLSAIAQDYTLENNEIKISKPISFETGTSVLKPESDEALNIIRQYLGSKTYISLLRVEGHVSGLAEKENQQLSEERATAVCKRLISLGVDCQRLLPVGFGSMKPVADNDTPGGKTANNRICFINAALKGKVIGGLPTDGGGKIAAALCN